MQQKLKQAKLGKKGNPMKWVDRRRGDRPGRGRLLRLRTHHRVVGQAGPSSPASQRPATRDQCRSGGTAARPQRIARPTRRLDDGCGAGEDSGRQSQRHPCRHQFHGRERRLRAPSCCDCLRAPLVLRIANSRSSCALTPPTALPDEPGPSNPKDPAGKDVPQVVERWKPNPRTPRSPRPISSRYAMKLELGDIEANGMIPVRYSSRCLIRSRLSWPACSKPPPDGPARTPPSPQPRG